LSESISVVKVRGGGVNLVEKAGYPTFKDLDGVSKEELLLIDGVGPSAIEALEKALKKRGGKFVD
jgi:hypothetical protein